MLQRLRRKISRKSIVTAGLILVVFVMSLGYAALSQYMDIEGVAIIDRSWIVKITDVTSSVTGNGVDVNKTFVSTTVTMEANIPDTTSEVTYTIKLKNEGNIRAKLHSIEQIEDTNTSIKYTISGVEEGVTTLNPGEENIVTVTIKAQDGTTNISEIDKSVMLSFNYVEQVVSNSGDNIPVEVYDEFTAGEEVKLLDRSDWYVVKDSNSTDGYVTLISKETYGIYAFDTTGSTEYNPQSETNVGYIINQTIVPNIKTMIDNNGGNSVGTTGRLLTYNEWVKADFNLGTNETWMMSIWEPLGDIDIIMNGGAHSSTSPTVEISVRPVITTLKVNIKKPEIVTLSGSNILNLQYSTESYLTNYTISGNSVQNGTPKPETPIEIESVGDKTKNLIDVYNRTLGTLSSGWANTEIRDFEYDKYYVGLTMNNYYASSNVTSYSISDDSVTITINQDASGYGLAFPVKVNPNTNYVVSDKGDYANIGLGFYTAEGEFISDASTTSFTTPENCETLLVVLRPSQFATPVTYSDIQLEEGTTATTYEPYGYKIPIKVTGKNLWSGSFIRLTMNANTVGHTGSSNQRGYEFKVKPNTTYSVMVNTTTPSFRLGATDENYVPFVYKLYDGSTFGTITTSEDTTILAVYLGLMTSVDGITLMIVEGEYTAETMPEYEPYQENKYTIYLDKPLRKVGEYSDYIDFENGVVSQRIGNSIINQATALADTGSNDGTLTKFYFHIHDREVINRTKILQVLSEQLKGVTYYDYTLSSTNNLQSITCNVSNTALFVKMNTSLVGSTMEQINSYLSVNPLNVYYILETPSNTPIELPKISIPAEEANIFIEGSNGVPIPLEVSYYKY